MEVRLEDEELSPTEYISRRNSEISLGGFCLRRLFGEDDDREVDIYDDEDLHLYRMFDEDYVDFVSIFSPSLVSTETMMIATRLEGLHLLQDEFDVKLFYQCYLVCCICDLNGEELTRERISWKSKFCCIDDRDELMLSYHRTMPVVCTQCLRSHVTAKIEDGIPFITCPGNAECTRNLLESEVAEIVSEELFERWQRLREGLRMDPLKKTCPYCSKITQVQDKSAVQVTCSSCGELWCFQCHAPWHKDLDCKQFLRGDKSLKVWAKNKGKPNHNAVRCPKCKVFIQKNGGCDHMTCYRCNTEFCYSCGKRYYNSLSKYFGGHDAKWSIFGCKQGFMPNSPVPRVALRGTVFTGMVAALPVAGTLLLGAGCVALTGLVVVSPVLVTYKIVKKRKRSKTP